MNGVAILFISDDQVTLTDVSSLRNRQALVSLGNFRSWFLLMSLEREAHTIISHISLMYVGVSGCRLL